MCKKLEELTKCWVEAKQQESKANKERLLVEEKILSLVKDGLKESGTTNLNTGLKIVRKFNHIWDQEQLVNIYRQIEDKKLFPFVTEFKPVSTKIDYVKNDNPDIWNIFQNALTIKEAKPSFNYGERK